MKMIIPIGSGLDLKITNNNGYQPDFPTGHLQKGLLLLDHDQDLSEEGVGFGVPVLMRGMQTIFPGAIQLVASKSGPLLLVQAIYKLNLEEKIGKPTYKKIENKLLYTIKDFLAALIRRFSFLRGLLTGASNLFRKVFGWETLYEESDFSAEVQMTYAIDQQAGVVDISMDKLESKISGITEVIIMNEQGANEFDYYLDSTGTSLRGKEIGCWDEITAQEASFVNLAHSVAFTLSQVRGAKLYRGRELIGSRLAWSGFGYSFPAQFDHFRFRLKIERIE
jgi:hypothetical protein